MKYAEIKAFMSAFHSGEIGRHELIKAISAWQEPVETAKISDIRYALSTRLCFPHDLIFPDNRKRIYNTLDNAILEAIR